MTDRWPNIPAIDKLVLSCDTSQYPLPGKIVPCLMCSKPFLMRPYSGIPDQICPECWKVYDECAKLICWHCRVVVARVKPGVTDSGFNIRTRAILHLDKCNICAPNLTESLVIEIAEWEKAVGRKKRLFIPVSPRKTPDA